MEMSTIQLEILIPTFNRAKDLQKNLHLLSSQIIDYGLSKVISISISDNCSEDETESLVADFSMQKPEITINYTRNASNIGLEPNVLQLLKNAYAPYVLWLGDDDYLSDGYLPFVLDKINNNHIGVIITGLAALKKDGSISMQRDQSTQIYEFKSGYKSMLNHSHLAHQMSGLVVKREGLYEKYISNSQWRNPYLFIFMAAESLLKHRGIYAPKFATQISDFNPKDWGYNEVGLLDEVFKSYYPFMSDLGDEKVRRLLIRFSVLHSYRYNINKWHLRRLIKQYKYLCQSVPKIDGFKKELALHLFKDYLLSWKK